MMRQIFITGSESFVGRELILRCREAGIEVMGVDTMSPSNPSYRFSRADIRDPSIAQQMPQGADAIVHLAAISRDADCASDPIRCYDVNVNGTLNVMRAARETGAKQFIFASSEWVYDKFENAEEKDENAFIDIANHVSEYAVSKLVGETNLRVWFRQGFPAVTILRFGIIYGPRKNNWSAVESLASAVRRKDSVTVGALKTGRRFVHVSDIACGIIRAIGVGGFNIINLSGDKVITLGEIIEESERIFTKKVKITESDPGSANIRNPANAKAKKLLDWRPEVDLASGLRSILPVI